MRNKFNLDVSSFSWALVFACPILLLCILLFCSGVYPFGKESFLTEDLKYQYIDFYTWYQGVLQGKASIFYSPNQGLGANAWGMYSYYLASPFNILFFLVDENHLTLCVFFITALKLGFIQVAWTWYCGKRFKLSLPVSFIIALGVTFGSWCVTNLRNPMWLDCLIILPVMMQGTYEAVRGGRWRLLAVSTACNVIVCWYTAYMCILFCVIVVCLECFLACQEESAPREVVKRSFLSLVKAFLLAFALSAWTFVPTVFAMLSSGAGDGSGFVDVLRSIRFDSFEGFARSLVTASPGVFLRSFLPGGWTINASPQLYCGFILELGFILALAMPVLNKKEKGCLLLFVVIILLSVLIRPLEAIWCGFRAPNGFYSRVALFFGPSLLYGCGYFLMKATGRKAGVSWIGRSGLTRSATMALSVTLVVSLTLAASGNWLQIYTGYTQKDFNEYRSGAQDELMLLSNTNDLGNYRYGKTYTRAGLAALNEGLAMGYKELSSYSSAHNTPAIKFLEDLGYSRKGEFSVRYAHSILLSDSLLSVKYISSKTDEMGLDLIKSNQSNGSFLYENPMALPIGYLVSSRFAGSGFSGKENVFENQNAFISSLLGRDIKVYKPLTPESSFEETGVKQWLVDVPAGAVGYVYDQPDSKDVSAVDMTINDGPSESENWRFQHSIRALGGVSEKEETYSVKLTGEGTSESSCLFYYVDYEELKSVLNDISQHQVAWSNLQGNNYSAEIECDDETASLLVSLPHEDGWTVFVNGKKVEAQGAYDGALTVIPLNEGDNYIEMHFVSPGFSLGVSITFGTLVFATLLYFYRRMRASSCRHVKASRSKPQN